MDSCDTHGPVQAGVPLQQDGRRPTNGFEISPAASRRRSIATVQVNPRMIRLEDLPNVQRRALDLVKEVAAEKQLRPFLVGGPVRDLILGRHDVVDVDLTIEEGASTLARALAKQVGGRLRS